MIYHQDSQLTIHHGDALDVLRTMPDNSIDLICTDPPYAMRKAEWDKFASPAAFLAWIGELCEQWQRVLKPNGSLYCFASPERCHDVQREIRQRFNVLNDIRWVKDAGWHKKADKRISRSFHSNWEAIIFAEQGQDGICEPVRKYLNQERERAGFTVRQVAEAYQKKTSSRTVTGMAGHWFSQVQWCLITEDNYYWLRALLNAHGDGDYLRAQYEDLCRPFSVTADVPYTDVWDFPTVQAFKGKHPCQKPLALISHIVRSSSREGATVLDCFSGSGVTGEAALRLGRNVILIEKDAHWVAESRKRCEQAAGIAPVADFAAAKKRHEAKAKPQPPALPLFDTLPMASNEQEVAA